MEWLILTPAVLGGGGDWAFPIVVGITDLPTKGKTQYLSPREVDNFAKGPEGNRILSGQWKRMHRILFRFLEHSPNKDFAQEAKVYLSNIGAGRR